MKSERYEKGRHPPAVVNTMKTWALAALAILIIASVGAAVSASDYVRWNNMLDECVYFYDREAARVQCFVPEDHCESKLPYLNEEKRIDTEYCYYIPRKEQQRCQEFTEGDLITLQYEAVDPDKEIGPAGELIATFEKPFNSTGQWQTKRGDAGSYITTITVSDGEYNDESDVCFNINPLNEAPTVVATDVIANEGEVVKLNATCQDEGAVNITYTGKMKSSTWRTTYDDAGIYQVTITCTDSQGLSASKDIAVSILDRNRPPRIIAVATRA